MDDKTAADVAALNDMLEQAAPIAFRLLERDPHGFGEVAARVELVRRQAKKAGDLHQYKAANWRKMALLRDLADLRGR